MPLVGMIKVVAAVIGIYGVFTALLLAALRFCCPHFLDEDVHRLRTRSRMRRQMVSSVVRTSIVTVVAV